MLVLPAKPGCSPTIEVESPRERDQEPYEIHVEVNMKPTDNPRWITTTEAAEMSGLSRPLVEKILRSGDYEGEILWPAEGTHPSFRADEFEAWIKPILSASDPGDLEQISEEAILDHLKSAKELSKEEKGDREAS